MSDPRISSETIIGVALMKLGITFYAAAGADHSDEWFQGDTRRKLANRFGNLFDTRKRRGDGNIIVVVGRSDRQYVVKDLHELECVWRKDQIQYAFSIPAKTFDSLRGDIAIAQVPALEVA